MKCYNVLRSYYKLVSLAATLRVDVSNYLDLQEIDRFICLSNISMFIVCLVTLWDRR